MLSNKLHTHSFAIYTGYLLLTVLIVGFRSQDFDVDFVNS